MNMLIALALDGWTERDFRNASICFAEDETRFTQAEVDHFVRVRVTRLERQHATALDEVRAQRDQFAKESLSLKVVNELVGRGMDAKAAQAVAKLEIGTGTVTVADDGVHVEIDGRTFTDPKSVAASLADSAARMWAPKTAFEGAPKNARGPEVMRKRSPSAAGSMEDHVPGSGFAQLSKQVGPWRTE